MECRASRTTQSCSSFPTQSSHPGTSAEVTSPQWLTSSSSHCSSSRNRCLLLQTALLNLETSMSSQKRRPYTGFLNRETSGDNENTFLHCGDGLEVPPACFCCTPHTSVLSSQGVCPSSYLCPWQLCLLKLLHGSCPAYTLLIMSWKALC